MVKIEIESHGFINKLLGYAYLKYRRLFTDIEISWNIAWFDNIFNYKSTKDFQKRNVDVFIV